MSHDKVFCLLWTLSSVQNFIIFLKIIGSKPFLRCKCNSNPIHIYSVYQALRVFLRKNYPCFHSIASEFGSHFTVAPKTCYFSSSSQSCKHDLNN